MTWYPATPPQSPSPTHPSPSKTSPSYSNEFPANFVPFLRILTTRPPQVSERLTAERVQHQAGALRPAAHLPGPEVPAGHVAQRAALLHQDKRHIR